MGSENTHEAVYGVGCAGRESEQESISLLLFHFITIESEAGVGDLAAGSQKAECQTARVSSWAQLPFLQSFGCTPGGTALPQLI